MLSWGPSHSLSEREDGNNNSHNLLLILSLVCSEADPTLQGFGSWNFCALPWLLREYGSVTLAVSASTGSLRSLRELSLISRSKAVTKTHHLPSFVNAQAITQADTQVLVLL